MKKFLAALLLLPTLAFAGKLNTVELNKENTISFNKSFTLQYIAQKQVEAINLCYSNIGSDINIVLYTPGGSISAGKLFFDTLKALPCTFNTITIFSASMGYQTVQNLGKRYILPSGVLMSHRASVGGLSGEIGGELDAILSLIKKSVRELDVVASDRVGISLEEYRSQISDELWLTAELAVRSNHADEVVLAKCNKDLMTTSIQVVYTFFGAFDVEFSDCPLVTGPIRVLGSSNGNPMELLNYYQNIEKHVEFSL